MLGDAGEHYALSKFTFAGRPGSKMPDGWTAYDLAVETGIGLTRVSVKTRSESPGWKTSPWFMFDERRTCDWLVFIFLFKTGEITSWVVPFGVACSHANKPGAARKEPHMRDLSWSKLRKEPLAQYENNWELRA
jgi:hypothetical protein